jgi:hypothetical protein
MLNSSVWSIYENLICYNMLICVYVHVLIASAHLEQVLFVQFFSVHNTVAHVLVHSVSVGQK